MAVSLCVSTGGTPPDKSESLLGCWKAETGEKPSTGGGGVAREDRSGGGVAALAVWMLTVMPGYRKEDWSFFMGDDGCEKLATHLPPAPLFAVAPTELRDELSALTVADDICGCLILVSYNHSKRLLDPTYRTCPSIVRTQVFSLMTEKVSMFLCI